MTGPDRRSPRRATEGERGTVGRFSTRIIAYPASGGNHYPVIVVDDLARDPGIDYAISAFERRAAEPVVVCSERWWRAS